MILTARNTIGLILALCLLNPGLALAGDDYSQEEIKREISYLAKKLLDMSGEDSVTVESAAVVKAYIGICTNPMDEGLKLTCVTPDSAASRAGLQTGDLVTAINESSMAGQKSYKDDPDGNYWDLVNNMKPKDKLEFTLQRDGDQKKLAVEVGSLEHPAYSCRISRD